MADETTIDFSKLSLDKLESEAKSYLEHLKSIGEHTVNVQEFTDKFGKKAIAVLTSAKEALKGFSDMFGNFTEAAKMADDFAKSLFKDVEETINKSGLSITDMVLAIEPMSELISKNITGMGRLGDAGLEAGNKISTSFEAVAPLIEKAFKDHPAMINLFSTMAGGASKALSLRREIEAMTISQGKLNGVMNEGHTAFKNADNLYDSFAVMNINVATNIRQTVGSVMDLTRALSDIPNSLREAFVTDVATIATTAHRSQLVVAKELSDMYTRLGTSQKDSLENLANIHDKAGDSKLRMESFASTVNNVASNFKMLGDNTVAATTFVKAFDDAFKSSQISPEAMRDVISSIGDGIHRMDAGKKAFVSASTGGPGGLAGAVQMDYAIQTGNVDEVIKKTMVAMQSQFGGQVVTLKDAAENQSLAGEFYKQIQYLTQVSGIAKDEDQAKRILEAMKNGVVDNLKPGSGAVEKENVLERHLEAGIGLQQQTNKTLMDIHIGMEKARLKQDDIYQALLVGNNQSVNSMFESVAKKSGIELPSHNNDIRKGRHSGVRESITDSSMRDELISQSLDEMIKEDLGDFLKPIKKVVEKFSDKNNKAFGFNEIIAGLSGSDDKDIKEAQIRDGIAPEKRQEIQNINFDKMPTQKLIGQPMPPPESTSRLPLIPPLQLPKTTNQIDSGKIGNVQSQMEHTFKPLTLEITGPGIKQLVQLELQEQKRGDLSQAATGLRL